MSNESKNGLISVLAFWADYKSLRIFLILASLHYHIFIYIDCNIWCFHYFHFRYRRRARRAMRAYPASHFTPAHVTYRSAAIIFYILLFVSAYTTVTRLIIFSCQHARVKIWIAIRSFNIIWIIDFFGHWYSSVISIIGLGPLATATYLNFHIIYFWYFHYIILKQIIFLSHFAISHFI